MTLRIHAVFWNALGPGSVAYTLNELLDNMPEDQAERRLWCLSANVTNRRKHHSPALPNFVFRALCKAGVSASVQGRIAGEVALRSINPGDVVYIWPPYDLTFMKRAQDRGAIVVAERINCMGEMVKTVLSRAFARRGLPLPEGWCAPEAIAMDREQMLQCDFITAPNSLVAQSAIDAGIAKDQILETSYGFSEIRLAAAIGTLRPKRSPVFAFVGSGIVRKGLDVLLEAWAQAGVDGKLVIAGDIDEDIRREYARTLARGDVEVLGFVQDIAGVYAAADVFVFPTHEEGGPQVTYEAAACGLPSIVSAMGAGRIVRDEEEGLIIDPLNVGDLAGALAKMAEHETLRHALGVNAAARAKEFKWSKVGMRLFEQLSKAAVLPQARYNCRMSQGSSITEERPA